MDKPEPTRQALVETGIEGLDIILRGGLIKNRLFLLEGDPGSGKTTLALQYLLDGARRGERVLFVMLSETANELRAIATEHGWSLDGIDIFELLTDGQSLNLDAQYTMFHPSEVELTETTKRILAEVTKTNPVRVVLDSLSELRLLAQNSLRFRRQMLALKQFFGSRECSVLFVDDRTGDSADMHLRSIAHGVIRLELHSPDYGPTRRRLQVIKIRGWAFSEGYHDFRINRGGLAVFPRLVAAEHSSPFVREAVKSGQERLDDLLGGGLSRGTSTLITGPAGSGKSTISTMYAVDAARRGQHASIYLFDESIGTFMERSRGLGLDVASHLESGRLGIRQIDPAEMSVGEFAHIIRKDITNSDTRLVIIDSLNGYLHSMPSEKLLTIHLHELLTYLGQKGVTTILIMAQHGLVAAATEAPVDTSYLADTVILTRFFERTGEVRQAISVIKKRTGRHERTIRELKLDKGIVIGDPLREFQGVLSGQLEFVGSQMDESSRNVEKKRKNSR